MKSQQCAKIGKELIMILNARLLAGICDGITIYALTFFRKIFHIDLIFFVNIIYIYIYIL